MEHLVLMKRAIAVVLLLVILFAYVIVPLSPVGPEGGDGSITPYTVSEDEEVSYDDCTEFWKMLDDEVQVDLDLYTVVGSPSILRDVEEPERTLYIVLGVERDFKKADIEILKEFYRKGGKLIIADDFGYGGTFGREFGIHFYGHRLFDQNFYWNYSFPVVHANMDYTTYELVLDTPSALHVRPKNQYVTYLANSSRDSYIDLNDNNIIDIYDVIGPAPVVIHYERPDYGGSIVFISDPGIFIDDKFLRGNLSQNNQRFVRDLIVNTLLQSGGKIIFDEGRHEPKKELRSFQETIEAVTILTSNPRETALLLTGMVLVILIGISKAKDKERWVHEHDVRNISRTADLPETRRELKQRLRAVVMRKVKMANGLTNEELQALTKTQIASIIKDHELNELMLNEDLDHSNEDLRFIMGKVRKWEKAA